MYTNNIFKCYFIAKSGRYTSFTCLFLKDKNEFLVCNQSPRIWRTMSATHRRLYPTMELIIYSFVLYLQHGRHDNKCKPSIARGCGYSADRGTDPVVRDYSYSRWVLLLRFNPDRTHSVLLRSRGGLIIFVYMNPD